MLYAVMTGPVLRLHLRCSHCPQQSHKKGWRSCGLSTWRAMALPVQCAAIEQWLICLDSEPRPPLNGPWWRDPLKTMKPSANFRDSDLGQIKRSHRFSVPYSEWLHSGLRLPQIAVADELRLHGHLSSPKDNLFPG